MQTDLNCDILQKSEVGMMSESKLRELSVEFSVDMLELVKHLKAVKETIISTQIGRSGTSIGANIHEVQYAQSKKDFVAKPEITLKEASETGCWLELLYRINYIDAPSYKALSAKAPDRRSRLCRRGRPSFKLCMAKKVVCSKDKTVRYALYRMPVAFLLFI